jgi:hypothetical protein
MGYARFKSDHEIEVALNEGGSTTYTAPHIVVGVGGIPAPLGAPGQEHVIDSDDFFDVEEQPKKALVIGAGYIAVEMAGILGGLGTQTSLMFRGDTVRALAAPLFARVVCMDDVHVRCTIWTHAIIKPLVIAVTMPPPPPHTHTITILSHSLTRHAHPRTHPPLMPGSSPWVRPVHRGRAHEGDASAWP